MTETDERITRIIVDSNGSLTRRDAMAFGISSSSFTKYIRENNMIKVAPGIYATNFAVQDAMYTLQKRYPKIIFSGLSSLYLNHLTDKIPDYIEFTIPKNYRVRKSAITQDIIVHIENNQEFYFDGNVFLEDEFGNTLCCHGKEKTIIEMIRKKDEYDSEIYIKAIRRYLKEKSNDVTALLQYAKKRNIEKRVREIMEVFVNGDE